MYGTGTQEELNEAGSIAYNVARIVRLSTGRFALYRHFENGSGIPIIAIGTIKELEPHIPTEALCSMQHQKLMLNEAIDHSIDASDTIAGRSLAEKLGLAVPKLTITRRV